MCGIAGLFDPSRSTGPEELGRQVAAMTATLVHRGPDAEGAWSDPERGLCFGHRRLAVVGLGPHGAQPMVSPDGRWVVDYNGEVYNHRALRHRLAGEGVTFRGGSDTEVLLGAVQQWGVDGALEAIEGMFAIALWDRREGELHLVRDRFGEKPLYYGWVGRRLAFASELKALCTLPGFRAEIDRDAVALYLRHNCVPAPHAIYRGVAKLLPGQLATADRASSPGGPLSLRTYWSARQAVEKARAEPIDGSAQEMADQLESVLSESVAARMVADVPVGAFLSGGVDSSLVVALMQRHSDRPVRTFTVGFADRAFDESAEAAAVARHLGTDHVPLEVTHEDATSILPSLPDIWDEPFGDISEIPMHLVSALARSQVTVALSGDGGTSCSPATTGTPGSSACGSGPRCCLGPSGGPAGRRSATCPPHWSTVRRARWRRCRRAPRCGTRPPRSPRSGKVLEASGPEDAYLSLVSYWDGAESMVLGAGPTVSMASRPADWPALHGITEQMLWLDLVGYLPDDILTKLDRAAMAVSLETRVPFLDRGVFDLAWRLPMSVKLHQGTTKWLLRQVLYRHVPAELVERPKMGFGFPIGPLLRGPLRPWAEELLDEGRLRRQGLLDPVPVRRAWRQHLLGRRDLAHELWDVLALEAWLERWMPALGRS